MAIQYVRALVVLLVFSVSVVSVFALVEQPAVSLFASNFDVSSYSLYDSSYLESSSASYYTTYTSGGTGSTLVLVPKVPFDIRVTSKGGGGVITGECSATAWGPKPGGGSFTFNLANPGVNGYRTVTLPVGTYDIAISCPGHIPRSFDDIVVTSPIKNNMDVSVNKA